MIRKSYPLALLLAGALSLAACANGNDTTNDAGASSAGAPAADGANATADEAGAAQTDAATGDNGAQ